MIAADCNSSANPTISVKEERNGAGTLTGVMIEGRGFTANGTIHVNYFLKSLAGGLIPSLGPTHTAGADGTFRVHDQPVCPDLSDLDPEARRATFVTVVVPEDATVRAATAGLHPGPDSDCVAF